MISIKKHIEGFSENSPLQQAYLNLVDSLIEINRERLPATSSSAKLRFGAAAQECSKDLRQANSAAEVDEISARLKTLLERQWTEVTRHFFERERELAGIISLLADTAGKLDAGNAGFYANLRQSAQKLDSASRMDNVAQLRAEIKQQSRFLTKEVGQHEARTNKTMAGLRRGIDSARLETRSMGRFVNTDELTSLPSKRHGEQMLPELLGRNATLSVAVINVEGLRSIAQTFNENASHAVVHEFASRLEKHLSPDVHLYRWAPASFVAFADMATGEELRETLSQFALALAASPIAIKQTNNRPVRVAPAFVVNEERRGTDPKAVQARIDGFCAGGSGQG